MSQYTTLPLRYVPDPIAAAASEDPYWLTIEQVVEDDKATLADAAEVIDELYDLEACVDVETVGAEEDPAEAEPPSKDKLLDIAADKFDLEECKRRKTGTYEAVLKIARSHQDEKYRLILSVGKILSTEKVEAKVSLTIPVEKVASLVLPQPVLSGLAVSWLGPVYGSAGAVPQPEISALHNTLSWPGVYTGTIKAEYTTVYDLVTVEIPGIPKYAGSPLGDPQDSRALAFYHFAAYPADISPPPEDSSADAATLAEVCGWDLKELDQPEEPEPLPEPLPPPEYGCIDYSLRLADPNYYAEKCCEPKQPDGCRTRTEANPGGHTLPQEIIDELTREHEGPIEFIAVGPTGVEGCGKIYYEQIVRPQNCCEDATPIVWDSENSVEVLAAGTYGWVFVTGGRAPYRWQIRGQGMTFDGYNMRDAETDVPYIMVYAGPFACGSAPIEVTDGCSITSGWIRATVGRWSLVYKSDGGLNGGSSAPPFQYAASLINVFDDPGTSIVKTGIKGKYKVAQEYTENCPVGWAFSTLEAAITRCKLASTGYGCSHIPWYHKTGGAFYDSSLDGRVCGAISATWPEAFPDYKSGNLGFNNYIYIALPWYSARGLWINVISTKVYEWIC